MGAYEVTVEQKRGIWLICVPEIPEVRTQARRLTDVAENAREAIAVWLNAPY
jgi:predicted RNase H-like HicB family nuclease